MTNSEPIKPEVGQVWKYKLNNHRIFIYDVSKNFVFCLYKDLDTNFFDKEVFMKYYTYIGKAKGSISDLFEVENYE